MLCFVFGYKGKGIDSTQLKVYCLLSKFVYCRCEFSFFLSVLWLMVLFETKNMIPFKKNNLVACLS